VLSIGSVNMLHGGFGPGGSLARLDTFTAAVERLGLRAVMLQELPGLPPGSPPAPSRNMPLEGYDRIAAGSARLQHDAARSHLERIAGRTGMTGVLGAIVPGQGRRLYTAILVRESGGITITGTGPPPMASPGAEDPPWCQATIEIEGVPHPLDLYSVHFPARMAVEQLRQAQRLANLVIQRGRLAHLAGDWKRHPATGRAGRRQDRGDPGEEPAHSSVAVRPR
jgi:hypothetical protein